MYLGHLTETTFQFITEKFDLGPYYALGEQPAAEVVIKGTDWKFGYKQLTQACPTNLV